MIHTFTTVACVCIICYLVKSSPTPQSSSFTEESSLLSVPLSLLTQRIDSVSIGEIIDSLEGGHNICQFYTLGKIALGPIL